jgi:hypothetical protein
VRFKGTRVLYKDQQSYASPVLPPSLLISMVHKLGNAVENAVEIRA